MLVKATNPMTKFLKNNFPAYNFRLEKFTLEQFKIFVDIDIFSHENDYNPTTNKIQAIKVIYPDEFYALPRYITTNELIKAFRRSDKTTAGFIQAIRDEIEI